MVYREAQEGEERKKSEGVKGRGEGQFTGKVRKGKKGKKCEGVKGRGEGKEGDGRESYYEGVGNQR